MPFPKYIVVYLSDNEVWLENALNCKDEVEEGWIEEHHEELSLQTHKTRVAEKCTIELYRID